MNEHTVTQSPAGAQAESPATYRETFREALDGSQEALARLTPGDRSSVAETRAAIAQGKALTMMLDALLGQRAGAIGTPPGPAAPTNGRSAQATPRPVGEDGTFTRSEIHVVIDKPFLLRHGATAALAADDMIDDLRGRGGYWDKLQNLATHAIIQGRARVEVRVLDGAGGELARTEATT